MTDKANEVSLKKTSAKKTDRKPTVKRKTNLLKLCAEMNKMVADAVDREIVKRFKIIIDTGDDDISKAGLASILSEPENLKPSVYEERLQPYIKHYLFMLKRKGVLKR